jgi:transcription elongation factor/antiterminator RfaH
MNDQGTWNDLTWYLVRTHPKQEDRADSNLKSFGIETLAPKFKERQYNQYTGKASQRIKPFFPSYIFARFRAKIMYHKVRYARGIRQLVSFGAYPVVVDEEIIAIIQSRIIADGFARLEDDLETGNSVIIKDGPFKNFAGIFERKMKDSDRIRILLQTVSYQAHIEIDRDMVSKIGDVNLRA